MLYTLVKEAEVLRNTSAWNNDLQKRLRSFQDIFPFLRDRKQILRWAGASWVLICFVTGYNGI